LSFLLLLLLLLQMQLKLKMQLGCGKMGGGWVKVTQTRTQIRHGKTEL